MNITHNPELNQGGEFIINVFFLFSIIYFFLQNSLIRRSVKSFVTKENFFFKSRNFYNLQILMKTIAMTDSGGGAVG